MSDIDFYYDDDVLDIIERIDFYLLEYGLTLEIHNREQDGIETATLRKLTNEEISG